MGTVICAAIGAEGVGPGVGAGAGGGGAGASPPPPPQADSDASNAVVDARQDTAASMRARAAARRAEAGTGNEDILELPGQNETMAMQRRHALADRRAKQVKDATR
ncbi:MAG: hypothetical protein ACJ8IK_03005 [Burkholderiaceae bacterium]